MLNFDAGACYRIDGTLEVTNRNGLDFEGNGATFRAGGTGATGRSHWRLVGGSRFIFRNMTVQGANPAGGTFDATLQHQHAFDLMGASAVEIDHATATAVYGDCVYVGQGWNTTAWSSDVHVHDSTCIGNGRMGIAVTAGRNVLVENSSFSQIALTAFDVEPNGATFGANNVTFRGNHVSGRLPGGFFTAIGSGPVDYVTVSGNTLTGAGMYMAVLSPPGQRRSHITITGNGANTGYSAPGSDAVDAVGVDVLTVTANYVPLSGPNMALATVSQSCRVNVSGNTFPGGVVEARVAPYPCGGSAAPTDHLTATSTTLAVTPKGPARASAARRAHSRRAHGRVKGSRSGRIAIRLERLQPRANRWVKVRTKTVRLGRHGKYSTLVRKLRHGKWRARATFLGRGKLAASSSPYRYFLVK